MDADSQMNPPSATDDLFDEQVTSSHVTRAFVVTVVCAAFVTFFWFKPTANWPVIIDVNTWMNKTLNGWGVGYWWRFVVRSYLFVAHSLGRGHSRSLFLSRGHDLCLGRSEPLLQRGHLFVSGGGALFGLVQLVTKTRYRGSRRGVLGVGGCPRVLRFSSQTLRFHGVPLLQPSQRLPRRFFGLLWGNVLATDDQPMWWVDAVEPMTALSH